MNKTIGIIGVIVVIGIIALIFTQGEEDVVAPSTANTVDTAVETQVKEERNLGSVPDVVLTDLNGEEVSLRSFIGTPLVINSWAVWCPFCLKELPDFSAAQEEFGDAVVIIAINRGESQKKQEKYLKENDVLEGVIYLLDSSDSFYRGIGGFSMPETIFVDETGIVRVHKRGVMALPEIREKINSILPRT